MDQPLSEETVERLERLAKLRVSGVLTDAEFELQKRMLLATPAPPLPTPVSAQSGLTKRPVFWVILVSTVIIVGIGLLWLFRPGGQPVAVEENRTQPQNPQPLSSAPVPPDMRSRPEPAPANDPSSGTSADIADVNLPLEQEAVAPVRPEFSQYPATESGGNVPPDFSGPGRAFYMFRTRISDGFQGGVNFSGNDTVVEYGCGTGCRDGTLIDRETGRLTALPLGGEANPYLQWTYRRGSNLLLARWEDGPRCVFEAFVWNGSAFGVLPNWRRVAAGRCPVANA